MIAVYIQPGYTQVVVAKQRKKQLKIQSCKIIQHGNKDYLSCLENINPDTIQDFQSLFEDVKSISQKPGDEIYIVLPDYVFLMVNCFGSTTKDQTRDEILNRLALTMEQIEYSTPITTSPEPQKPIVTACVLSSEITDVLIEAANNTNVHLVSIEPASISFLRTKCAYNQEELALFIFNEKATFIAYSQLGGLFKVDNNELSLQNLGNMTQEEAEQTIVAAISEFEMTAQTTFEYLNRDLKYTIFAKDSAVKTFNILAARNAPMKYLPDMVDASYIPLEEQQDWLCVVGTLLQYIDFSSDEFEECIDSYEQVSSGNILPEEIQNKSKKYYRTQQMYKLGKAAIIFMAIISAMELIAILLFSTTHIPPGLEDDYASAKESITKIEAELNVINLEQQEDQQPLAVYNAVMASRPQEIGFVSFEVGSDSNTNSGDWVKIKMLAADPLKFQNYINELSSDSMFGSVAIPQITTDNGSGAKVATMTLGKKGGK